MRRGAPAPGPEGAVGASAAIALTPMTLGIGQKMSLSSLSKKPVS